MDNPAWNDTQLVRASQQGDQRAFAALVNRYKGLVSGLAYSSTCDLPLSQDLSQEAFTVAWRKLSLLNDGEKFRPWVCGILRHLVQDALRERQRDAARTRALDDAKRPAGSSPPSPADAALAREQSETVSRALAQLPEELRLPLVLFYYEGHSSKAVAQLLGVSDDAIRQRLVRGRERLREEMMQVVDNTLDRQRPRQAFVVAVLAGLSKTPATTLTATKTALSAVSMKSLAASAGIAATLLFTTLALMSPSTGSAAKAARPPVSAQATAKAQALESTPAKTVPVTPAITVAEEEQAAPPQASNTDADDMALAASILDIGWETWKSQTQFSEASKCVNAWGYRAALGDTRCRERLLREACDPDSGDYGPRSNQILISTLGDVEYVNDLFARCANENITQYDRMGHFASLYFCIEFLKARNVSFPNDVIESAVTIVETIGPHQTMMNFLEKTATERARPMAEYYLMASLADGAAVPLSGGGFSAFDGFGGTDLCYSGSCLAARCLSILQRIGNPASRDVVRNYLTQAGPLAAAHAAFVLTRLGEKEYGLDVLKEILAKVDDPTVRSGCLNALVDAGEKEYLNTLRQDMLSSNHRVRLEAYCALCRLNDASFVESAVQDFAQYWDTGFWTILAACPVNSQATPSGVRDFRNSACIDYCLALANHPTAVTPTDKTGALMGVVALTALQDSPQAKRALSACMPVLYEAVPPDDTYPFRDSWSTRLVFLLHWGDAETRQAAADRLTEAYRQNPDIAGWISRDLVKAANPEALPLLVEIMKTHPADGIRINAAVGYFAIKSGKRW
ncbi:MAG: RNA polymerase sigma factor [FCB group bacterium]|jgi:RNA polymerase sigma factor (sigma-70 family)|nr:RNA polymerase sigma factor [FCB group bacterium]